MTMSKVSRRDHHAQLGVKARGISKRASCDTETLYVFPTKDTTFNVTSGDITFEWDTSCLSATLVDLTLQAPHLADPLLKIFQSVTYADGQYTTTLNPTWWNSTSSVALQMSMASADSSLPSFTTTTVVGPVFEAVYTAPETTGTGAAAAAATTATRDDPLVVQVDKEHSSSLPAGSIFAAVFFPVLAVAAAAIVYILWVRRKQAKKSKRWSAAVDQRMSRISTEWRASTAGSLQPDMRQSGDRRTVMSMHSTAGPNFAGRGVYRGDDSPPASPFSPDGYTDAFERPPRVSYAGSGSLRVSFGDGARPTSTHLSGSASRSSLNLGAGASSQTVGSRKSYQAPAGSRISLGLPSSGAAAKARWSVAGPVAVNLDMRAPEHAPWVLGEEDEQEILDPISPDAAVRPQLTTRRSEGSVPLSIEPALPPTARLISPMASPVVDCPPSPDLGQASASWFGMTPSLSSTSLSPDEKLQRHADAQVAAANAASADAKSL